MAPKSRVCQYIVDTRTLAGCAVAFTLVLAWAVGLTSYVLFHDEVLSRLRHHYLQTVAAYEERITDLKADLERSRTRGMVEREQFERKIDRLAHRQVAIETQQQMIGALADRLTPSAATAAPRPPAIPRTVRRKLAEEDMTSVPARAPSAEPLQRVDDIERALDLSEAAQTGALDRIEDHAGARARQVREVLSDLDLPTPAATVSPAPPMGGPFVPAPAGNGFAVRAARVAASVDDMQRLEQSIERLPLRRPIGAEAEVTSGFGLRLDPFLRRPAHHGGIDFRAGTGAPVRATAAGRIKEAGWQSGFGNMVEIDHGNGTTSVFAHLSSIEVSEGQSVEPGQIVGTLGSTGRSTGPHLHYETRVLGEATDPQRFLKAGVRLGLGEPN